MAPKQEQELQVLTARKEQLFSYVQATYDMLRQLSVDRTLKNSFLSKASIIDDIVAEFKEIVNKIQMLTMTLDESHTPDFSAISAMSDLHGMIKLGASKFEKTTGEIQTMQPKLPSLDLPSFNGTFNEWPIFYETFKTLIHDNKSLSTEQKIQYLVSKLHGSALNVCAGIPSVAANYNTIWDALIQRYQDPRSMAAHYMDTILNFKAIKIECKDSYRNFIDQVGSSVLALKALNIEDLSEYILYSLTIKKLEVDLCKRFETKVLSSQEMPKFTDLLNFVKDEVRIMQRIDCQVKEVPKRAPFNNNFSFKSRSQKPVTFISSDNQKPLCVSCKKETHSLYMCSAFNALKTSDRLNLVKANKLCFNCLMPNHSAISCNNKTNCKKCKYRHHTMLHLESFNNESKSVANQSPSPSSQAESSSNAEISLASCCSSSDLIQPSKSTTVLLSTVKVNVLDQYGNPQIVRMLLDSASMSNFITTSCCSKLGIKYKPVLLEVGGIGGIESQAKGITSFSFSSRYDAQKSFNVSEALVVDKITNKLPICPIDINQLAYLKDLSLSDDTFYIPDRIDGLIGAELFSYLVGKPKSMKDKGPIVLESVLGDIVMGKVPIIPSFNITQNLCAFVQAPLEAILHKFWSLEEVPTPPQVSNEDKICEEMFTKSCTRKEDGSYCVSIPFKSDPNLLGDSLGIAKKRFLSLERRHDSNLELKSDYVNSMNEYMQENYASKVDISQIQKPCYFMPHHPVVRPEKVTSKVRVVFDLSCATTSGLSLNDLLYTGPTLYNDLFKLLITFRMFPYACTADIRKMFLQVHVQPEDQKYLSFLWRDSPQQDIECYQMNRVVFGCKPSPYLAQRVLRQLAIDESKNYPQAAEEVKKQFYMDDYLSSFLDEDSLISTVSQCSSLLSQGGFQLTKFASNCHSTLQGLNKGLHITENVQWDNQLYLKVLGIEWCPSEDNFVFKVQVGEIICTKRGILSTVAKIYDVLGLISPVTTYTKIILKELWKLKIDWDQRPPDFICQQWSNLVQEFSLLSDYKIPRHLSIFKETIVNLVGFSDASEKALGACVYTHVIHTDGTIKSQLVCGKSKLSPIKYVTIPRLELCAALLLAKLMSAVIPMFKEKYHIKHIYCLSDSKVTLSWISSESTRWKTFVANRVSKIQDTVSPENWFHVKGTENPADCLSRGLTPKELINNELWFHGPVWLSSTTSSWPLSHSAEINEDALEEEKPASYLTVSHDEDNTQGKVLLELALRCSSWMRLLRIICYVLKFAHVLPPGKISPEDMLISEMKLLKALQHQEYASDIKKLENNKNCSDLLLRIHAFLQDGVIRCGGRISNAPHLDYSQVHPIVLPKSHHIVNLIIDYYHCKNFHTGPHLLIALLRKKYWIFSCRDIVRRQLKKCNTCFKHNPKPLYPMMGDLPVARVSECKAFLNTGVDYAGPFNITISKRRGVKSQKAYLCLFVCLATKALHLELASDLSTPVFLAALRRFVARRGTVNTIYCDQGTNFIGASNSLDELYQFLSSPEFHEAYSSELLAQRITFQFNPPASPHFGGLWEANVRSVKVHLYKSLGSQILTYEELNTLIVEIEAVLNSRPLCQINADSRDPIAITPAHFLCQTPIDHLPFSEDPRVNSCLSDRYKLLGQLISSFWRRWSTEYLSSLQERFKWNKNNAELKVGLLVLIKSENTPVLSWPMGKIVELFPGKDGIARVASVRTSRGIFKRPAVKLCPLPCQ